jgi:hypothetical protein
VEKFSACAERLGKIIDSSIRSCDLQNPPQSGPMVGDSSTADYRVLDEVIDIAHLVLEMSLLTDHVKPSLSGRFPKL